MTFPTLYLFANALRRSSIAHHKSAALASLDGLTGCLNRQAFANFVEEQLSSGKGESGRGALLMVDVDHFKSINDRFGHHAGDIALSLISSAMKNSIRSRDAIGRVGGEEFAIFLPEIDGSHVQIVAERIRIEVVRIRFMPGGEVVPLSVSVGGITFAASLPLPELLVAADAKLYEAKRQGRNRVRMRTLPE